MNDIAQERFITSLSKSLSENNIECKITGLNEITLDFSKHDNQIRADAIDEFANRLLKICADYNSVYDSQIITIAEELKNDKTII